MISLNHNYFINFENELKISKTSINKLESFKLKTVFNSISRSSNDIQPNQILFYFARFFHKKYKYSLASKIYLLLIKNFPEFSFCYFYLALIKEAYADFAKTNFYFSRFFSSHENYTARGYYLAYLLKVPHIKSDYIFNTALQFSKQYNLRFGTFSYNYINKKIRIGYICSFINTYCCEAQLLSFIRHHNQDNFTAIGYGSESTEAITSSFDSYTKITKLSDIDVIHKLRNDHLDIIIDCSGFSPGNSLLQLSSRCAPVQICYMNHTATTGLRNIDYILADKISVLPQEEKFFTEKILRKDDCFFCFDFRNHKFPSITASPCLKNGYITFGFLGGHTVKINAKMVEIWSSILKSTPNSKLLIINNEFKCNSIIRNLKKKFAKYGIDENSLELRPGVSRDEILHCYNDIDISFDSWPYCGGNTLAESLWMGVPCVSLLGERFASRYGSSILNACDLDFLIAETFDEYIQKCMDLASNFDNLNSLRTTMRERINSSGFNDSQSFAKSLEEIFSNLVNKARKND